MWKRMWKRKIDRKMKDYGEIDYDKKTIRINPKKGELLNTALEEELHRIYPNKPEEWIKKEAKKREKQLSPKKAIALLKRFEDKKGAVLGY